MKEVPAVVHFIDRDEATVMMVDSNCQRENLTLMEKARSYRMKAEAPFSSGQNSGTEYTVLYVRQLSRQPGNLQLNPLSQSRRY